MQMLSSWCRGISQKESESAAAARDMRAPALKTEMRRERRGESRRRRQRCTHIEIPIYFNLARALYSSISLTRLKNYCVTVRWVCGQAQLSPHACIETFLFNGKRTLKLIVDHQSRRPGNEMLQRPQSRFRSPKTALINLKRKCFGC